MTERIQDARVSVSALRFSADQHLPGPQRSCHGLRPRLAATARSRPSGAAQTAQKALKTRLSRPLPAPGANQVWTYDFVFDRSANGQQLNCPTIADAWTKEGLAIEVDGRIRSGRVIEVLARLVSERGAPITDRSSSPGHFFYIGSPIRASRPR